MDDSQFDRLARFAAGRSRREVIKVTIGSIFGGALAVTFADETDAAQKRRSPGEICRKHADCISNICSPKDSAGRQRCSCATGKDCPQPPGNSCQKATCSPEGVCGSGVDAGAVCDSGDSCTVNSTCSAGGVCIGTPRECTTEVANATPICEAGICTYQCDEGFGGENCLQSVSLSFSPVPNSDSCYVYYTLKGFLPNTLYSGSWEASDEGAGEMGPFYVNPNGIFGPTTLIRYPPNVSISVTFDGISSGMIPVTCPAD